jgi:hypothetical protein
MNFKNLLITAITSTLLAGCGSGTQTTTDPSKLKPLTDAEKAEIKKQDEAINAEEGQSYDAKKKK